MTARPREERDATPSGAAPVPDDAVSPVVGMILVLGISVVGIAGILYWGLPAIDEMKANVEFRTVESQFLDLDGTIKELVAGTTERTAKRWLPSLNRGQIHVQNATETWLYATETYNSSATHDFTYAGFSDGNNAFTITSNSDYALSWVKVEGYVVTGTSTLTTLNVSTVSSSDDQMQASPASSWAIGETKTFYVWVKDTPTHVEQPLRNLTFKFKIYTGPDLVAEAWYVTTGRIEYQLAAGLGEKRIIENNGAVLTGDAESQALVNTPPLPPPSTTNNIPRFFGRAIVLNGNTSFVGEDRFDLLISLNSTATLASYDCALTNHSDCVETVKIWNYGDYQDAWYRYLTNDARGYDFSEGGSIGNEYLVMRESYMGFTLLQSVLRLTGG